ncbi:MAG: endonuclease/exonuclease/phosphatase family protein [Clostridia bacterium]|nr:endonuclease/exonuclease/phosphatase family protein [Clostridia bacterium]
MVTYRFISCNARTQTPADGEQQFMNRVDFLCETLLALDADVIGLQEIKPEMRKAMIERMPGYGFLGSGRDAAHLDEGAVIAYKQTRLMPERLFSEILSPTPHICGSTYGGDQSPCPRVFSSVDFMPIDGGQPFRFMNVHTDHVGENARKLAVMQMQQHYAAQNALRPMPTVVTGDFNALPNTLEIQMMTAQKTFYDLSKDLAGTFHGYDNEPVNEKIDYIFATHEWQVKEIWAPHPKQGNLFFSDHDPIIADVII